MSAPWDLDEPAASQRPPSVQGMPPADPKAAPRGSISTRILCFLWSLLVRGAKLANPTRILYLLSALLVLGATLASLNPRFGFFQQDRGFDARLWPWEVFADAQGVHLDWLPPHAFAVAMLLAGFSLVACVFLAPGRLRGSVALAAFVFVGAAVMPGPGLFMTLGGTEIALALLLGGCLACRGAQAPRAGVGLMLMAWVALALFLLFPYPTQAEQRDDPLAKAPYASPATEPIRGLLRVLEDPPPSIERPGEAARPMHLGDWARGNVLNITFLLSALVGLWALLRRGRGGARWLLAALVLVNLLGPAVEHALRELAEFRVTFTAEGDAAARETELVLRSMAQVLLAGLRLAVLPLALGLGDLLRGPRAA